MNNLQPRYAWYLLWWTGLWILITVITQIPECYQRCLSICAEKPSIIYKDFADYTGKPAAIYKDLAGFATSRALLEVPFGLLWGSVSWGLQFGSISVLRRFSVPRLLQSSGVTASSFVWPILAATIMVSLTEGLVFGLPLAALNTSFANFDLVTDDAPPVTITDQNIMVEAIGIVSAFVLSSAIAGCMAGRVRLSWKSVKSRLVSGGVMPDKGATMEEVEDAGSSMPDAEDDFDLEAYLLTHMPEYDEYVGKHLLISLTYLNEAGGADHKSQLHGIINRINEAIIAVDLQDTGEEFTLPADLSALTVAAKGEYRLKPSGAIVVDPDYLVVYTISKPEVEDGPGAEDES